MVMTMSDKEELKEVFNEFNISISDKELTDLCALSVSGGSARNNSSRNSNSRLYGIRKSKNINFMRGGRILK